MLRLAWTLARAGAARLQRLPAEAATALGHGDRARPSRRRLLIAMAVVLPVAAGVHKLFGTNVLVMSPSIEAHVVRPAPGPIAAGDLVMFALVHPIAGADPVNVTKIVLCLPGQTLTRELNEGAGLYGDPVARFYCDGLLLGVTRTRAHDGRRLDPFAWADGPIPDGWAYVGSHHPDGFDSRYFGLVPLTKLRRMERVL